MVSIKNNEQINFMREAGQVVAKILATIKKEIVSGMSKKDLDMIAERVLKEEKAQTAFKGYQNFPNHICVSVNDELIHGIADETIIQEGDLVSIDAGATINGYFADGAITFGLGQITAEEEKLINITEKALLSAIEIIKPGATLGDIGATIQIIVEEAGYFLPKDYSGHGIGANLHEEPYVLNYGKFKEGLKLKPGMVICIEPMVQIGTEKTITLKDGWTVVSQNGAKSCHFEHTILITPTGYEILTKMAKDFENG